MNAVTVAAPPSKSLSHRAVIAAALAHGESHLANVLESDDLTRTLDILRGIGAKAERTGPGAYRITGLKGLVRGGEHEPLDCFVGESGTTCRLLTAVLAAGQGLFRIHGSGRMHERPMRELTNALQSLGASVAFEGKAGCPPLLLRANGLAARRQSDWTGVNCDESSQYFSGLLLAAPLTKDGLRLLLMGQKAVSWPYVGLTLQTLADFGPAFTVEVRDSTGNWAETHWRALRSAGPGALRIHVPRARYQAFSGRVEGDYSGASYLLAAGALGPNPVTVTGLKHDSMQGDAAILPILARMGAGVRRQGDAVTVSPPQSGKLRGLDLDMGDCPDIAPTVAVLAARATGETRIRGAAHLRLKESDRLLAPAKELLKTGCAVTVLEDGLRIAPKTQGKQALPGAASAAPGEALPAQAREIAFSCHNDHRMAMSLALLELAGDIRVKLDDPGCVAKSFPDFWNVWRQIHPQSSAGEAS